MRNCPNRPFPSAPQEIAATLSFAAAEAGGVFISDVSISKVDEIGAPSQNPQALQHQLASFRTLERSFPSPASRPGGPPAPPAPRKPRHLGAYALVALAAALVGGFATRELLRRFCSGDDGAERRDRGVAEEGIALVATTGGASTAAAAAAGEARAADQPLQQDAEPLVVSVMIAAGTPVQQQGGGPVLGIPAWWAERSSKAYVALGETEGDDDERSSDAPPPGGAGPSASFSSSAAAAASSAAAVGPEAEHPASSSQHGCGAATGSMGGCGDAQVSARERDARQDASAASTGEIHFVLATWGAPSQPPPVPTLAPWSPPRAEEQHHQQ